MKWVCVAGVLTAALVSSWAQPALPPQERPSRLGTVLKISEADGIALQDGTAAPLAEGLQLEGVEALGSIEAGDLVEIVQDDNGLVSILRTLPKLPEWKPLIEVARADAAMSRFWWRHDGQDYPDSVYTSDLTVAFQQKVTALSATVAYLPKSAEGPVRFSLLGPDETALWEQSLEPGEAAEVKCPLAGVASVILRCRRPDTSVPDHTHCVWGTPRVLLREFGQVALAPAAADDLAAGLAGDLGHVNPGRVAVAAPRPIGVSPQMSQPLQEDLLVALGRRYPLAGRMAQASGATLTDTDVQAAQSLEAETIAASEIRYQEDGSTILVTLVDVATGETLARAETKLQP